MCRKIVLTPEETARMKLIKKELRRKKFSPLEDFSKVPCFLQVPIICDGGLEIGLCPDLLELEIREMFEELSPTQGDELEQLPPVVGNYHYSDRQFSPLAE